jgi:hypothetical protein
VCVDNLDDAKCGGIQLHLQQKTLPYTLVYCLLGVELDKTLMMRERGRGGVGIVGSKEDRRWEPIG